MMDVMMAHIPGLRYQLGYLDPTAQAQLLQTIDAQPWLADLKRRVQHYGYRYDYTRRTVAHDLALGPLPNWAATLALRLHAEGYTPAVPDQVIINEYLPGQGIASHVDCLPCFGDTILSLSLGSPCIMVFTERKTTRQVEVLLAPGSLLVMHGAARYDWLHGIPQRKSDVCAGQRILRARRVSLTFRTVRHPGTT